MKIKKKVLIYGLIILAILIATGFISLSNSNLDITPKTLQCIAENSILYVQTGCSACEVQKNLFGNDYKYLNIVDCVTEKEACQISGITATPTWIIHNKKYVGVQQLSRLKELTSC